MSGLPRVHGLYAVTDPELCGPRLADRVREALDGGAALVQYRNKSGSPARQRAECRALVSLCAGYQVPLIVNDDPELALETGAQGVHVGQDTPDLQALRQMLGPGLLLGVTCHASLDLARTACAAGADYVAFGSVFPSTTKPRAPRVALQVLTRAAEELPRPIVAIGGISADNARLVIDHGAHCIAVISALFGSGDVRGNARRLSRMFPRQGH